VPAADGGDAHEDEDYNRSVTRLRGGRYDISVATSSTPDGDVITSIRVASPGEGEPHVGDPVDAFHVGTGAVAFREENAVNPLYCVFQTRP
jgi:hypothetical protein